MKKKKYFHINTLNPFLFFFFFVIFLQILIENFFFFPHLYSYREERKRYKNKIISTFSPFSTIKGTLFLNHLILDAGGFDLILHSKISSLFSITKCSPEVETVNTKEALFSADLLSTKLSNQ